MGLYKGESFTEDEYKNINAATGKPFGQAGEEAVQNKAQDWRNQGSPVPGTKQPDDIRSLGQQLMDWSGTPAGNATIGGLGLLAAAAVAHGVAKRKTTPEAAPKTEPYVAPSYDYETTAREVSQAKGLPQPSTPVAEPTPTPNAPTSPTVAPAATTPVATQQPAISGYGQQTLNAPTGAPSPIAPTSTTKPVDPVVQARIDAIKEDQRRKQEAHENEQRRRDEKHDKQLEKQVKSATPKTVTKEPVAPITSPSQIPSIEVAAAQASIPANISATDDVSKKDLALVGNLEKGEAVSKVTEAVGKPAPTTTKQPVVASPEAVAKSKQQTSPKVAVDTSGLTKEQASMKKYLVSFYGGGEVGEKAYNQVKNILGETPAYLPGEGGGLSKEATETIKAWRKENIAGPKVNLTKDMKNIMKGAGGVAALAAIPGFAQAAQRKDFGAMTDIATDFAVLPFAQSREAGMPRAKEESIISGKFSEAQKLGSPYRSVPPPI